MIAAEIVAEYQFILVTFVRLSPSGKTAVFEVVSRHGDALGEIKWFPRWRQYVFFPAFGTVYSAGCLDDVATFIRDAKRAASSHGGADA